MMSVGNVLRIIALVAWAIATIGIPVPRLNLIALGLFLWFLATFSG